MRSYKKTSDQMRFCLFFFLALAFCGAGVNARAEGVEIVSQPRIEVIITGGYALSAQLKIDFNPHLEETIQKGIALPFMLEFELERPRWYWMNKTVARASQTLRLSYSPLTRQYRLATGSLHQSFPDLNAALRSLSSIYRWHVANKLVPGETLNASLRVWLDTAQMPKLFLLDVSFSSQVRDNWELDSGWYEWKFTVPFESPSSTETEKNETDTESAP